MSPIKKIIIITSLVLTMTITASITAMADSQQIAGALPCNIRQFDFSEGVVPVHLQEPGIAVAISWCDFLQIISNVIGLLYACLLYTSPSPRDA